MNIPKVLHVYWNGSPMSCLQYLTVYSFKKLNPDWTVKLWMPDDPILEQPKWETGEQAEKYTGKDYLDKAKKLCDVEVVNMKAMGFSRPIPETQRSEIMRWWLLYEYGGCWADMDVLFIKPLDELLKLDFDCAISHHAYTNASFYLAKPKRQFFKETYELTRNIYNQGEGNSYQALCCDIFNRRFDGFDALAAAYPEDKLYNLPDEVAYPYSPMTSYGGVYSSDIEEMFFGEKDKTTVNTVCIHWYNGHPLAKKYQNGFAKYRRNKSAISKYAGRYV